MRILARVLLLVAVFIAAAVAILSAAWPGSFQLDSLNVIAAALAVITASLSAWSAQKLIEQEEDARRPQLYLSIDVTSRYNLAQVVLRNVGGRPAFDIYLTWDQPLLDHKGVPITFTGRADGLAAPVLMPGETLSAVIDVTSDLAKRADLLFSGSIRFSNRPMGKQQTEGFLLSAEKYRQTLLHVDEMTRTLYELQKVPGELHDLASTLHSLETTLAAREFMMTREMTSEARPSSSKARKEEDEGSG